MPKSLSNFGRPSPNSDDTFGIVTHTTLNRPDFDATSATLHPVSFSIVSAESQMHLRAWALTDLGKSTPDFVVSVSRSRNAPTRAMIHFGSKDSAEQFEDWLTQYKILLSQTDLQVNVFPDLPNGTFKLTYVDCPHMEELESPIKVLAWVSENCTKPFYFTNGKLAFEEADEAFAFQMRFKGSNI